MDLIERILGSSHVLGAKIIGKTKIFQKSYYERQAGKQFPDDNSAIKHYLKKGYLKGFSASPFFSERYYLSLYKDVEEASMNPLLHYVQFGATEGRRPHLLFVPAYFLSQISQTQRASIGDPLEAFIEDPYLARPCALFDAVYYASTVNLGGQHPFEHYLENKKESPHPLFDEKLIASQHAIPTGTPVLAWYMSEPHRHQIRCHELFDSDFYLQQTPELRDSAMDPLSHYVSSGDGIDKWPNRLFWSQHYKSLMSKDEGSKFDTALTHYIAKGERQGKGPNPWFDPVFYQLSYPNAAKTHATLLAHYMEDGWRHDFLPSENFSPKYVRQHYPVALGENPLEVYLLANAGEPTLPERMWIDPVPLSEQMALIEAEMRAARVGNSTVSVVIPVYNNFAYTVRCVYSIITASDKTFCDIIIADDGSSDQTEEFFSSLGGLTYIRNPENLGFLRSCNNAAKSAVGEYVFLLNNDTAVTDGWLDRLVETFDTHNSVGLVGAKLYYPNGLLQEAGGILWRDGAANFGKFDDPDRPEYSYLRDVDYVSGAAIMLPAKLWRQIGGFDDRYAPAYCEDSDLCLQIKQLGLKVMMQPASKIVHFEGVSNGTDINSGVKAHQVSNSKKLALKWEKVLSGMGVSGDFSRECVDRSRGPRILIVDATFPTPDQDAGSLTVWYFLKIFRKMGYQVTFIAENLRYLPTYTENIQALGVECRYAPYDTSVHNYIVECGHLFDAVMLYRVANGGRFYEDVRKFAPKAKIIFDTVDLHFLREERQAALVKGKKKSEALLAKARETRERELHLLKHSDVSIVLSENEKQLLKHEYGVKQTCVIPIVLETQAPVGSFDERRDIAFVGGFQHTPNVDAVLYFVEEIWPEVKTKLPGVKFFIVGSKPPAEVEVLQELDKDIIVTGYIPDLGPVFDNVKLSVAPLRFGAGIKGKIGTSMSYGVPCVATKMATEGMGLREGEHVLVADRADEFVELIVSLYDDGAKWASISEGGMQFVEDNYSVETITKKLSFLMSSIGLNVLVNDVTKQ
ncbi:glycosyltransferase [Luminiphilus sp.]|nr:glycosyltransferase [Luminiphilus sp.]MDC3320492.1 glycosyltransferase [Luminiphilus sp.]